MNCSEEVQVPPPYFFPSLDNSTRLKLVTSNPGEVFGKSLGLSVSHVKKFLSCREGFITHLLSQIAGWLAKQPITRVHCLRTHGGWRKNFSLSSLIIFILSETHLLSAGSFAFSDVFCVA